MFRSSTPLSAFASLRTGLGAALCALAAVLAPPAHAQLRGLGLPSCATPLRPCPPVCSAWPMCPMVRTRCSAWMSTCPLQAYLQQRCGGQRLRAPVIFMVHGGARRTGDKAISRVVQEKVARWVPKGFVFISVNYRLYPTVNVCRRRRTWPWHWPPPKAAPPAGAPMHRGLS